MELINLPSTEVSFIKVKANFVKIWTAPY